MISSVETRLGSVYALDGPLLSASYFISGNLNFFSGFGDSFDFFAGLGDYSEIYFEVSFLGWEKTTGSLDFTSGFGDSFEFKKGLDDSFYFITCKEDSSEMSREIAFLVTPDNFYLS